MVEGAQPYTKAQRLLNLLMALRSTHAGLDRSQIRAVVRGYDPQASAQAFERMFERDKDELRAMGIPVVTRTDAAGVVTGYRVEGEWALPPLDLTRSELAVLGLAVRAWQRADLGPAALNALRKVEAQLGTACAPVGSAPLAGLTADSPALQALVEATSTGTPVTFGYRKMGAGSVVGRHVQPWGTVWWRGHWYLVGFDTDRGDLRVFRASRIEGAVRVDPNGSTFEVPAGFEPAEAIGRFTREQALEVQVVVPTGTGASLRVRAVSRGAGDDGADLLSLAVSDLASGVGSVLAYAPYPRIVGPDSAVAEARAQLQSVLEAHRAPAPAAGRALSTSTGSGSSGGPGTAQFARLLALVPWLAANSGVQVADAAAHFGVSEDQLLSDLGSVITSGADDWTLFDIQYWEDNGEIHVLDALDLDAPLTLTPDEGFALVVALDAMAAIPGGAGNPELGRVRAKLTTALGSRAPAPGALSVRVDLPEQVVTAVERALAADRAVELTYVGAVRDEITQRRVDPLGLVMVDGYGYLRGYCRSAGGLRMFRVDRIRSIAVSEEPAREVPNTSQPDDVAPMAVSLAETGRSVLVDLPAASAVLDQHPVTRRWVLSGGWVRAELPVGDYVWARRLVLGSAGQVVLREPQWLVDEVVAAARDSQRRHRF